MQLSLTQAAQLLGKTRRQLEYLIRQGRLPATKVGARWVIDDADLPLTPGQRQTQHRRADALRDAATEVLDRRAPRAHYSMENLVAFSATRAIWQDACAALPAEHPAVARLRAALDQLAIGCHRFERTDKHQAYHQARDTLSLAACALLAQPADSAIGAAPDGDALGLAKRIEGDAIPAIAGLLRRAERRGR